MRVSTFTTKEGVLLFLALVAGFMLAIGFSVWAATTVSTNLVTDGHVKATSTVQATGDLVGYGSLLVGGTTTEAITGLNVGGVTGTAVSAYITGGLGIKNATTTEGDFLVDNDFAVFNNGRIAIGGTTSPVVAGPSLSLGGAAGTHADLYVSGGLGVGNATTSDKDFIVGTDPVLSFTGNGRLVVGATSTALSAANTHKFIFDGGSMSLSSGGTGTTSLSIMTEATDATQGNACIEMKRGTTIVAVTLNSAGTAFLFTAGACGGN